MSTVKTYRKGLVSRGELVFDQNLNPLQCKKASKTISLKSWIANTLPKTLERANAQANQASIDNAANQLTMISHLGSSQFSTQPYAPSQYANGYQVTTAAGREGMCELSKPRANGYRQSETNIITLLENLQILQDDLSEAMDMSSDAEDDLSEKMDLSSGPEADNMSEDESPIERVGGSVSRPIDLESEPELDEVERMVLSKERGNTPSKVIHRSFELAIDGGSDGTSTTPRMSSTPTGFSGSSSHTSVGPSNLKDSTDELGASFDMLQAPSRSSSLSSQLSPAKSATPPALKPQTSVHKPTPRRKGLKPRKVRFSDLRPRTAIPTNVHPTILAQQGIHAAYSSRLNPFALHPDEYQLLRNHICQLHVTAYLNIRNRILRLWVRNPLVSVTAEEAAGCALASRWLGLAEVGYEWLVRKGYINFGCVEAPDTSNAYVKRYKSKRYRRKTVVVVGAGMSGLGCARQLEGLFEHYRERWTSVGEEPPKVILLEGRNRIGGRVYSHPLKNQKTSGIPEQKRSTAEMGAHIIIGFDNGNPLNMIVRGQLALHYYALKDNSTLHDTDGRVVNEERDSMVEKLYNDVLDRASVYRHKVPPLRTVEGDKELIEAGRDPQRDGGQPISATEIEIPDPATVPESDMVENVPGGMDKLTGRAHMVTGSRKKEPPALAAERLGWKLASSVLSYRDLNLDVVAKASGNPTLGAAMDEAVKQYQFLLDLSPQDMRLLNWHYANLEYANAANVGKLSLGGWDQDAGNEFEGVHAQVIGGYQQVPRGILHAPSKLDLRTRKVAKRITYDMVSNDASTGGKVFCEDGEIFEADHIVLTTPLGVLKDEAVAFDPPLPSWKLGPIQRLGFGTLNKVILVYDAPFWKVDQDMFGLLREPEVHESLDQEDYIANRGRFYFFWNCIKTTGRPVLISLMAGDAAHQAETASDTELVAEVTHELAKIFQQTKVPEPLETIVTRWGKDRFARGSYSYVGNMSKPGDYEAMAAPTGTLHFAGEATCATHPATVHGAYISGLRAASEVIDDLIGPIEIPSPLVPWPNQADTEMIETPQKRKAEYFAKHDAKHDAEQLAEQPASDANHESEDAKQVRLEAFESDILDAIKAELGLRPSPPGKPGSNPFLLFTGDHWADVKKACDEARVAATGNPENKASRNEVRATIGQLWRAAPEEQKRPYFEQTSNNRRVNQEEAATYDARLASWDTRAMELRRDYVRQHPGILSQEEEQNMWRALGVQSDYGNYNDERRAKKMSGYAEDSDSNVDL